jgi:hypothetical protein
MVIFCKNLNYFYIYIAHHSGSSIHRTQVFLVYYYYYYYYYYHYTISGLVHGWLLKCRLGGVPELPPTRGARPAAQGREGIHLHPYVPTDLAGAARAG